MSKKFCWVVTGALTALLVFDGAVYAAVAPAEQNDAQNQTPSLEEIVVTAQRKSEALTSVPVAVSAYTSKQRDLLGIETIEDYANFTPGMNYTNIDRISIRGSGRLTFYLGNDPGVANYVDGFYSASTGPLFETPLFITQTEVLRGPQGTLYGRNSLGGAININHRDATSDFQGEVRTEVGNYGTTRFEGYVSGPISDSLRFMLGASREDERDGYLKNTAGANTAQKGETYLYATLAGDVGDKFTWNLKYEKTIWQDSYGVGRFLSNPTTPYDTQEFFSQIGSLVPNPTYGYAVANPGVTNPYTVALNSPQWVHLHDNDLFILHTNQDLEFATLKYIGGYQRAAYAEATDADYSARTGSFASPLFGIAVYPQQTGGVTQGTHYYTNELDLASKQGGQLEWIGGLFQLHSSDTQTFNAMMPNQPQLATLYPFSYLTPGTPCYMNASCGVANPTNSYVGFNVGVVAESLGAFSQADYRINDQFKIQGGLRYTYDHKTGNEFVQYALWDPDSFLTAAYGDRAYLLTSESRSMSDHWGGLSGTVDLDWNPTEQDLIYGRYSHGYQSGGFLLGSDATVPKSNATYVDGFEVGYKSTGIHNLTVQASAYFNNYNGLQINLTQFNPASGHDENDFINLDARVYGAELETTWRPLPALEFLVSYAYMKSMLTQGCNVSTKAYCYVDPADPGATDPFAKPVTAIAATSGAVPGLGTAAGFSSAMQQVQTLKGDQVPQSPQNKIAVAVNYTWHFVPGDLTASVSDVWQDKETMAVFNGSAYRIGSFSTTDFRVLWNNPGKHYTLVAFAKNAFDTIGYNSTGTLSPVPVFAAPPPGQPTDNLQRTGYSIIHGLNFPRTFGMELQYRF